MPGSRLRALGLAGGLALVLVFGLLGAARQLGPHGAYAAHGAYRAQVEALLAGRLALTTAPEGLAHDLAWAEGGVHQVWGLGVPLWQLPFEAGARLVGAGPFPDRVALGLWLALVVLVLVRALRPAGGERCPVTAGALLVTALLPALVALLRGRLGVYEEAAAYAYGAGLLLLGGVVALARDPSANRYLVLVALAGLTGLLRPTVWFYGLGTAVVATAIYLGAHRAAGVRRTAPVVALALAAFVAGGGVLYTTNALRFGRGGEFGHRLNVHALPGNIIATRFGFPFEQAGTIEAIAELAGGVFGRPERAMRGGRKGFYEADLHAGQSPRPRWREYYFTTFSWPYLPVLLAGLGLGARAWWRRRRPARDGDRAEDGEADRLTRWLVAWAVLGALPLIVFYLRSPSVSSRYQLDLAPGFAALLLIAWRAGAGWMAQRGRGTLALAILAALWSAAVLTGTSRKRVKSDPVDQATAVAATRAITHPPITPRALPAGYDIDDPALATWIASAAEERPHGLYLNGIGWDLPTRRAPVATLFYVEDPARIELEVAPVAQAGGAPGAPALDLAAWARIVRVTVGLHHGRLTDVAPTARGVRLTFALPVQPRGLQVAFIAFAPDAELAAPASALMLNALRWR